MSRRKFERHPVKTYSNLIHWLDALSMPFASAIQWINTIKSANGIRSEEVERSGIINYLSRLPNTLKVSKSELREQCRIELMKCEPCIQTEESTSYTPSFDIKSYDIKKLPIKIKRYFAKDEIVTCHRMPSFDFKLIHIRYSGLFGTLNRWFVFDEKWHQFKPLRSYTSAVEAADFLYEAIKKKFNSFTSKQTKNHYPHFSLLGKNHSYKEWLVTLPYWPATFESSHFDLMNIVLHLRTSHWLDPHGLSLFVVEEVQSDWHAAGKSYGYRPIVPNGENFSDLDQGEIIDAPFVKEWHELGIKIAITTAINAGFNQIAFVTSNVHIERYGQDLEGFKLLYDQAIPKSLKKIAKQFECKLSESKIDIIKPKRRIMFRRGLGWELSDGQNQSIKRVVKNEAVAMRYLKGNGERKHEVVQTMNISQQLKEKVESLGLPLYGWW